MSGSRWRACFGRFSTARVALALVWAGSVAAVPVGHAQPSAQAASGGPSSNASLPELPKLRPVPKAEADPAARKELDDVLGRLVASSPRTRELAQTALAELAGASVVGAVGQRIQELRASLDRTRAPAMLEEVRRAGRRTLPKKPPKAKKRKKDAPAPAVGAPSGSSSGPAPAASAAAAAGASAGPRVAPDDDGDWLVFLLAEARPDDAVWRDLVHLVACVRLLTLTGTTPAVRELIQLHAYFGELLRVDLQRSLARLGERAVPALLEARQHDAKLVQRWATKQLDILGKASPGEAIATVDLQVLADVLRAYGRTRDVDALRALLSFVGSERVTLREASREAVGALGEAAIWQLRDQYLEQTGSKAPRDWSWDRVARELFALSDRAREAEVAQLLEEGFAAAKASDLPRATAAFDRVLARQASLTRLPEIAATYSALGASLARSGKHSEALALLRKALRLHPGAPGAPSIEADIAWLGALEGAHGADRFLLERALALRPDHVEARAALASLEAPGVPQPASTEGAPPSRLGRTVVACLLGVLSFVAMLGAWRWAARPNPRRLGPPLPRAPAGAPAAPTRPEGAPLASPGGPGEAPPEPPPSSSVGLPLADPGDTSATSARGPTEPSA